MISLLTVMGCLTRLPALAADPKHEVAQTLQQFRSALAANDARAIVASCATAATVIDEFPPFVWRGNGCTGWWRELQTIVKQYGISELRIAATPPSMIDVEGSLAYAVIPARVTSVHKIGGRVWESLYATVVSQHTPGGWKIIYLTWTTAAQGTGK